MLDCFYLDIHNGEIINLIGLEDSGHKELFSILMGEEKLDAGEIYLENKKILHPGEMRAERSNGIFFIGNNEQIIPALTIAENLYIVENINYWQLSVSKKVMTSQANRLFESFGIEMEAGEQAKGLTKYEKDLLRLMRAYVKRAKLIIIDDILDDRSFERSPQLARILQRFKEEGIAILWMNTYPDMISEIADKVCIIQSGKNGLVFYHDQYSKDTILKVMIGTEQKKDIHTKKHPGKEIAFEAIHLQNEYFKDLNFYCQEGEILGIYDIQNKFSRELRRVIQGRRDYTGEIQVGKKSVRLEEEHQLLKKNKIALVDGNNYHNQIFQSMGIHENIHIAALEKIAGPFGFLTDRQKKYLENEDEKICEKYRIEKNVQKIGRQDAMKILYHRLLMARPKVLFCFEPYLRLDAISRQFLGEIFRQFSDRHAGIILSSTNLEGLQSNCDRILIIDKNMIIREIST